MSIFVEPVSELKFNIAIYDSTTTALVTNALQNFKQPHYSINSVIQNSFSAVTWTIIGALKKLIEYNKSLTTGDVKTCF